jgi:hypothetical protein
MSLLKMEEVRVVEDKDNWPHPEFHVDIWVTNDEEYNLFIALNDHLLRSRHYAKLFPDVEDAQRRVKATETLIAKLFKEK